MIQKPSGACHFVLPERSFMITINGKTIGLSENITVSEYLKQNQYRPERIAIELNGSILPKSAYDSTVLKDEDVMEIVSFVGGG